LKGFDVKYALLAVLAPLVVAAPARADCDHFKWSVARERAWFSASPAALPPTGGQAEPNAGYAVTLAKDVKLPVAPERTAKPNSFAAFLSAPKLAPGLYQITLSAEAWVDVAENGKLVKSSGFSGQHDCPGVRKSVRFPLGAGPATIEISNVGADKILFAIAPAK
jgi:hypothetical protein